VPTATSARDHLDAGREALARGAWEQARASFDAALALDDSAQAWEGRSWAAWWLDDVALCLEGRERAYRAYRADGDGRGAARMALWVGDDHLEFRGEAAVANGWFQRAERILEVLEPCPEHGWLAAFRAHLLLGHDPVEAQRLGARAREVGAGLGVVDLEMFGLATEGLALVNRGEVGEGMRRLDEAAAAALGGEYEQLAPAGWTCCYLIYACERVRDYDRAAQWCRKVEDFSGRMRIRFVNGTCRAHYAAVLVWHGDWSGAERELVQAMTDLTAVRPFWRSEAVVRLAELRRRQGRVAEAAELFAQAERHALAELGVGALRLDEGDAAGARDHLERVLRQLPVESATKRTGLLELLARALAALGEPQAAQPHVDELDAIAATVATMPLRASASLAAGVVTAAAGEHESARRRLEDAIELFAKGGAPCETAHATARAGRCPGRDGPRGRGGTRGGGGAAPLRGARRRGAGRAGACRARAPGAHAGRARRRSAHRAPGRGPAPRRRRAQRPPDRRPAGPQRAHRPPPHAEHLRQAALSLAGRGGGGCDPPAPAVGDSAVACPGHGTAHARLARSGEDGARPHPDTRRS
jgi:LuxR family transcriptional regulator, maltose regulon positive regulatory protein